MSRLIPYQYTITIWFTGPIVTQAAGAVGQGIDTAALCGRDDRPVLPGTLVQGNLRHCWSRFAEYDSIQLDEDIINDWLGKAAENSAPQRGRIIFSEFWKHPHKRNTKIIHYRIKKDQESGRVEDGSIQVISSPFASGKEVEFIGEIIAFLHDEDEAKDLKKWITKGLQYIPAMGAFKNIGFGRLIRADEITYQECIPAPSATITTDNQCYGLILKPDRPFCFSRHLKGNNSVSNERDRNDKSGLDNQFISEDFIPGGAIKGAITTLLRGAGKEYDLNQSLSSLEYPLLSKYIDKICITNAQPASDENNRPRPLPITTVSATDPHDNVCFFDIATIKKPGLIYGEAPAFTIDWKSSVYYKAAKSFPMPSIPERSVSIHTAIESGTNASKKHQLFSIDAVIPDEHYWLANITLPEVEAEKRKQLVEELQNLLSGGLHWLGKTGASATAKLTDYFSREEAFSSCVAGDRVIVTLLSPARLLLPGQIGRSTGQQESLFRSYAKNWNELSTSSLELKNFYSAQELRGGSYWQHRFNNGRAYNPEVFTTAGSVFVFEVCDPETARDHLNRWLLYGLPQLADFSENWKENPWISSNGYGEITVNLAQHTSMIPGKDEAVDSRKSTSERQWVPVEEL